MKESLKKSYYKEGDYIGVSGIEKAYEDKLRGEKGLKLLLKDVHNNIKGSFNDGKYDIKSKPGKNLQSSIDRYLLTKLWRVSNEK